MVTLLLQILNGDGTLDYLQSSFSPCSDLYPSVDSAELAIGGPMTDITSPIL